MTQTNKNAAAQWASQNPRSIRRRAPATGYYAVAAEREISESDSDSHLLANQISDALSDLSLSGDIYAEADLPSDIVGQIERLMKETRRNERSRIAINEILEKAQEINPEQLSFYRQELARKDEEIKSCQREVQAHRKATAVYGRASGSSFWRRLGMALGRDAENIKDALDRYPEMPSELAATLKLHSDNLQEFAGNSVLYAEALS
jgi:hypothetical protein